MCWSREDRQLNRKKMRPRLHLKARNKKLKKNRKLPNKQKSQLIKQKKSMWSKIRLKKQLNSNQLSRMPVKLKNKLKKPKKKLKMKNKKQNKLRKMLKRRKRRKLRSIHGIKE